MEPLKPEIGELLTLVKEKYQHPLRTTTDYEEFTLYLQRHYNLTLSASTLKRLWGYVGDKHQPRLNTLDKLAVYLGYPQFDAFCTWLKQSTRYNSSFLCAKHIDSSQLKQGERLQIGWPPNRLLTLEYQGDSVFLVVDAVASKLVVGDRFPAPFIYKELPLYLPWIERQGEQLPAFVAGRNGGITVIRKL